MNTKHYTIILIALTVLLGAGLVGSAFIANDILVKQSTELSQLKAQSEVASNLQTSLKKDKAIIAKYQDLNKIAETIVPQDKDQAETVGEIVNLAAASGISQLSSITFQASTLGGAVSTSTVKTSSGLTQVLPVTGISGVYILPISVAQDSGNTISYTQFITFLKKLEDNRRTAQVSSINIQPDSKNPNNISFTLTMNEYIKP